MVEQELDLDFRQFFELSADLCFIAGFNGYFRKVNRAVCDTLGYTEEELYSRPIDTFVFEGDQAATARSREHVRSKQTLYHFENRYVTKQGEIVWLSWTAKAVQSEKLVLAIAKNVTNRKQLEFERTALMAELQKANRDLKQLGLVASHDLRSPVSSLIMAFDLIDVNELPDGETKDLISMLKESGHNIHVSLSRYLDMLSDASAPSPTMEEVVLDECLGLVRKSIANLLDRSGAAIRADFSGAETVYFHKSSMESIFLNLITNAVKYARPGVPPIVAIGSSPGQLVFSDNGQGLDLDEVGDRLFRLNETFHSHPDAKGVGLYLVKRHMEQMGGTVTVESRVGEGTSFTLRFAASA
ncbi:MAG: PAS domain-containing sensor histidine kinase [Bacteroidetes bacterium CG12_big_fil_rev_8_21_14_0_65_60_17]|nr:MAG: PAS domain-containing sensor histidine kinase [Bacteroidetes bacterium CG12_big_fil_rev_8_21_14_0_65_60_17]